jgi:hypothetical protein
VEPFVSDGTTYLPVRAIADALGKNVSWDNATKSVYIDDASATTDPGQQTPTDVIKDAITDAITDAVKLNPGN